jgi:hypothetical protein
MRGAQIHPGGALFPDRTKMKAWALDSLVYQANDKNLWTPDHKSVLDLMRAESYKIGLLRNTRNAEWPDSPLDPTELGQKMSQDITDFGQDGKQCFQVFDGEIHDSLYILKTLMAFRAKRSGRFLYWTMEPKQFGWAWIEQSLIDYINADPYLWIIIQLYRSQMQPVSERVCVDQAMMRGIKPGKILCYYDRYEEDFNGVIYDYANAS